MRQFDRGWAAQMPYRLPGLTPMQQLRLAAWLRRRQRCRDGRLRAEMRVPARWRRSLALQGWWALGTEFQDRPLFTVLGGLASLSYPVLSLVRWLHQRG